MGWITFNEPCIKKYNIYMRWVQVTPGVTLIELHLFYKSYTSSIRVTPLLYRRFLIDPTVGKIALNDYFFSLIYLINNSFSLASFITFHRSHWILFNGVSFFLKFLLLDNVSSMVELYKSYTFYGEIMTLL